MSEPATHPRARIDIDDAPVGNSRITVSSLADQITVPDVESGVAARRATSKGAGRLAVLGRWLAETQGRWPPRPPQRVRLVLVGTPSVSMPDPVAELAATQDVAVRLLDAPSDILAAFDAGVAAADSAVDEGTDLLVAAGTDESAAPAVLVSAFTGAEPIALLPRGADAVDTSDWIARATQLRDRRRRVTALRRQPDELLTAAGSPVIAALAGCILRSTARRTAVVLDGTAALSAAVLGNDQQLNCARWWQVADHSPDPAHNRAAEDIDRDSVLDLGIGRDDGTAGVLTVSILRAAAAVVTDERRDDD